MRQKALRRQSRGCAVWTVIALKEILRNVDEMAARGMRVLGVAKALSPGPPWPDSPAAFRFDLLGLVGLADPLPAGRPRSR